MAENVKAVIRLDNGKNINLILDGASAPITVKNFVNLCEKKFYDGLIFHRVIPDFMIQGGGFADRKGALAEKRGEKPIVGEFLMNGVRNPIHHSPGVISMARTNNPNSATSQFFICVADCGYLDGQYAGFGKVADEESFKVALEISTQPTRSVGYYDDVPVTPIIIKTIEIVDEN